MQISKNTNSNNSQSAVCLQLGYLKSLEEVSGQAHVHIRLQKRGFIGQEKDVTDKHAKSSWWAGGTEIRNQTSRRNVMELCFQSLSLHLSTSGRPGQHVHTQTRGACRAQIRRTGTCGNKKYQPRYMFCLLPALSTASMILRNHVLTQSHNLSYRFSSALTLPHSNYPCYVLIHSWARSQHFPIRSEYKASPEITRWRKSDDFGQCVAAAWSLLS